VSRHVAESATWTTGREALRVIAVPRHLRRTGATAAIVGTILFCINQLDVVLRGDATPVTWVKVCVTYLVPFAVSNIGLLIGTRRDS
jgi:hypothetical protein